MTEYMTTAKMVDVRKPLEFQQVPIVAPGPGEVLIKTEVCGLCHSDVHFWLGEHDLPRGMPTTLGHEGIGTVVQVGENVTGIAVGTRVGIGYVYGTCTTCRECLTGHETHCAEVLCTGVDASGCFAEYAILRADWVTVIPDNLKSVEAAPLLCAGVAAYSAISKAMLRPGELAVIFGTGGLGLYSIQFAKLAGATVVAVDLSEEKLKLAQALGADYVMCADDDTVERIRELGGADASFNFAPSVTSWRQMIESARARARLVLVSLPHHDLSFNASQVIESGLRIYGSADGTRQELRQLMQLASDGKVKSVVESLPFAKINDAFERLARGDVQGRLVISMQQ
ncbi:MAG: zinc-dependent alcohol dehydrogenase [Acidiferrobacterales bacterium]|nr:zinc-dependent alcohol dehydrogenase [Acidiferrobacterales bacterium]